MGGPGLGGPQRFWTTAKQDGGTAQLWGFLVAVPVFTVSFYAVINTSIRDEGRISDAATPGAMDFEAHMLADIILKARGTGWFSQLLCVGGLPDTLYLQADQVVRFGLAAELCPGDRAAAALNLSFHKMQNLGDAIVAADPQNGHIDYEEARQSLALSDLDRQFHVRSWPILPGVDQMLAQGTQDPHQRVAYIGDYVTLLDEAPIAFEVQHTCGVTDGVTSADAWVDLTNNGTTAAAFEVTFSVPLQKRTVEIVKHTGLVVPATTLRVSAALPKTSDWAWSGSPTASIAISDALRFLGSCQANFSGVTMTAASTAPLHTVHAENLEELLKNGAANAKVHYASFDGAGGELPVDGRLDLTTSLGLPAASDTALHTRGWESFQFALADVYNIQFASPLGVPRASDIVHVVATSLSTFTPVGIGASVYVPADSVLPEVSFLSPLLGSFIANAYAADYGSVQLPFAAGGDVYPDLKRVLNEDLAAALLDENGTDTPTDDVPTLETYNVLVVGSNVDHNAMTSSAAKNTIRDWVYAGGYLAVFGSVEQAVQWLQPLFHSAIDTASGGLSVPDTTHPVLHSPNELDYLGYDNADLAWSFNRPADSDHFTQIVTAGDGAVLAVSDAGAFGKGRVLLTSWRPYDLLGTGIPEVCDPVAVQPECGALRLLHNFLTIGYRDLHLDYGPALDEGAPNGSVTRIVAVYHPEVGRTLEVAVQVWVF